MSNTRTKMLVTSGTGKNRTHSEEFVDVRKSYKIEKDYKNHFKKGDEVMLTDAHAKNYKAKGLIK